jgi:hypothetical protein
MKTKMKLTLIALVIALFSTINVYSAARVQVIHNSADAAASVVDVWLDNTLLLDNFAFRTASPFVDAPAGTEFTISIKDQNSTSPMNPIWSQNYTLADGETYILVANGIVSPSGYNPATPFGISVCAMGRENANMTNKTDVLVHHGSTDAQTVDVYETGVGAGMIVDNLMYADFAGYLELGVLDYILEIRDETGTVTVASFEAPLATLGLDGAALTVVASGFLNPANNSNGPAFGLYVALASGGNLVALPVYTPSNTARVQVIHNSADAAASVVDVWLDNTLLLDNFAFRTASPFVDAPAGTEFTISIKDQNSTSPMNPIWSQNYTLADGETYILVAEGIVSPNGYNPATPFDIAVYPMGRENANMTNKTDVLVHHGSTDAPTVDVYETGVGAGMIVDNLMYADFAGYLELGVLDYILEIRDETGTVTVASFEAPLATLGLDGAALTVVASGFLNPANNSNGPAFGLYVALASGGNLVALPVYTPSNTARVQVIHNSADAAASVVDVWLDNTLLLDNFAFRTASPFVDAPAGTEFTISIKDQNSTSPMNPIWSQNYTLADGETYILVAEGIVSPSGYNPATPFGISVYAMGRENANMTNKTDVLVHHGSTDAPTVDVYETGVGAGLIVDNLMYADFAGYLELGVLDYILEIRDETGTITVASFAAPLATLGLDGAALTVVASGFLNPANNSNGPAFGLYVALASGGNLVALPVYTPSNSARVQVIHNSADAAAAVVDVWLDNTLLLDNFAFRTASPFVDAPAGTEFTISIKDQNSTSPMNPIWSQNYTLADGETYILVANGIVSPTGYEPNQPFNIYVNNMGRETSGDGSTTDVLVFHGSTDAPVVDVVEVGVGAGTIIDNLGYGNYAGYLELPTANYRLAIKDEIGSVTVATYDAPLSTLGLGGAALTVVASGFLNPANNSNGANFGLWVALSSGGNLVELPIYLNVNEFVINKESVQAYPNPASSLVNIEYSLLENTDLTIEMYDLLGQKVFENQQTGTSGKLNKHTIDVSNMKEGLYLLSLNTGSSRITKKIQVVN